MLTLHAEIERCFTDPGAIAVLPGQAPFHVARAHVLETLGRKAEAQENRKRAAEVKCR